MLLQILINSVASVCTVSISRIPAALARSPGVAVPHGEVQIPCFASLVSSCLPTGRCSIASFSHWVEILIPTISWETQSQEPLEPSFMILCHCLPAAHSPELAWVWAPEVSFAEGLGYGVQLNHSHQNAPPHLPLLREDGCMQGRERVGRIVAVLILDLSVPISP